MADEKQGVLTQLTAGAMDLAELEVLTYEGTIEGAISGSDVIQWDKLLEQAKASGVVKLVAATQIKIDGDTILFVATGAPESLRNAHLEATAASQEYRRGLVEAFSDLLGIRT